MIVLITGASHTGKTVLAQKLLERYQYPYLSLDLLKMGLIRSGYTDLTPMEDEALTAYLWPIAREIIKTAIENRQEMIVEGCYIPIDWAAGFGGGYLPHIKFFCLVMSQRYIQTHFDSIQSYANAIEQRLDDSGCTLEAVLRDNQRMLQQCQAHGVEYVLIDGDYQIDVHL